MKGIVRPDAVILDESAIIPEENLVSPPKHFTHQLKRAEAYYYQRGKKPDGEFPAGTKVELVKRDGNHCRVVDEQGLSVEIDGDSLKEL